jgi:hypothetical protein
MIVGVCISALPGCGEEQSKSFLAGVRGATGTTLYEGLPHQRWEKDALKEELASKETVTLNGYPFYIETLALSESDDRSLREIACADDTFEVPRGAKGCGGFHPDYCVEWRGSDGSTYRMLVCFGCDEAALCDSTKEVHLDLREAANSRIADILKPYRKNRPARKAPEGE